MMLTVQCLCGCETWMKARSYRPSRKYARGHAPLPPKPKEKDEDSPREVLWTQ